MFRYRIVPRQAWMWLGLVGEKALFSGQLKALTVFGFVEYFAQLHSAINELSRFANANQCSRDPRLREESGKGVYCGASEPGDCLVQT